MGGLLKAAVLLLALCAPSAVRAAPDLRACPAFKPGELEENTDRLRKRPLPAPAALAALVRSDMDHYAVLTLSGGTFCVDTRWMEGTAGDHALSPDGRFLAFTWYGYEGGGYMLVDRSGQGQEVETGAKPLFSPSRRLLASVEVSESGYGSLNGFAVWQVEVEGLRELARIEDSPYMTGEIDRPYFPIWRMERWVGEDCVELTGEQLNRATGALSPVRFSARSSERWKPALKGCAAR